MLPFFVAQGGAEKVVDVTRAADLRALFRTRGDEAATELDSGLDLSCLGGTDAMDSGKLGDCRAGDAANTVKLRQQMLGKSRGGSRAVR